MFRRNSTLFFTIWSLWLSAEFLLGSFSHVRIHDAGDGLLPQLIASRIQLQKFGLQYMADYMASSVDSSSQFLVPFSNLNSMLFIIFPGWFAYGLLMFTQRFLASFFMFRLARDSLKLGILSSSITAILFSLFNFSIFSFTLYHQLGLPAIPFIIWMLGKINDQKDNRKYFFAAIFGFIIGYSNYFIYFIPYFIPLIIIWFFYIKKDLRQTTIINIFLFSVTAILIESQSIFALFLNSQFSHRLAWNFTSQAFFPHGRYLTAFYLVLSIVKSYLLSIVLAVLVSIFIKKIDKQSKKILSIIIVLLVIIFTHKLFQSHIPNSFGLLKTFAVDRFEIVIFFLLTLLAGISLNQLFKKLNLKKTFIIGSLILTILIAWSVKIKVDTLLNYAPYRSLYQHPDLINLSKMQGSDLWRVVTITGGGLRSSYSLAYGLSTVDTYLTVYPQSYHRFWAKVIKKRIQKDKLRYEDFMDWGGRIYLYGPQNFYESEAIEFNNYYDLELLSHSNVKYVISQKPVTNSNLQLLPSNYREYDQKWHNFSKLSKIKGFLKRNYFGPSIYVYENKKVLPRFFILRNDEVIADNLMVESYSPDTMSLNVFAEKGDKLIASVNYYPWWKATVNGESTPISRYRDTFMVIDLPAGDTSITLEYKPPYGVI